MELHNHRLLYIFRLLKDTGELEPRLLQPLSLHSPVRFPLEYFFRPVVHHLHLPHAIMPDVRDKRTMRNDDGIAADELFLDLLVPFRPVIHRENFIGNAETLIGFLRSLLADDKTPHTLILRTFEDLERAVAAEGRDDKVTGVSGSRQNGLGPAHGI